MMAKRPTPAEADAERLRREVNLDRDLKDISRRLGDIESSIRDFQTASLKDRVASLEARILKLESNQSSVIRLVLGTVGAALLATVVGVQFK